ncbi:MAG: PhnD/SsuA/transferrin family substrate-binding protein [Methanosarcinales archaeon]|nr:PhnD/SsuA/transferrin family substrate-binding protein [Methanosarcinales archaeon]
MFQTNNKYTRCLFILITIIVILISGCIHDNNEITVDLDNTIDSVVQYPPDETDVIYFGFDLRLSPKEDARMYAPFLQYMSEETGRTFKIHFTPCLAIEGLVRIVAYSDYYPSSGISANNDVDPELVEAVKKALLDFDPGGKHASNLVDWDRTEMPNGFIEAHDEDYAQLRELAIRYDIIE